MRQFFHHPRRLAAAEWIAAVALIGFFALWSFVPAWRILRTDFPNYYLAASLHRQGIPLDRVYEWRWFQRQKDHLQIDQQLVGFAPHPPFCALPMLPLANLPPLTAKHVWLILNLGFLALALWMFRLTTSLPWRRLLLLTFLCLLPLRQNFLFGQYYVLILLLLSLAYFAALRSRGFASGGLLAVAGALKIFPAVFLILFLRKRNWRSAAGLAAGGVLLAGLSVAVFGWNVHRIFLLEVLPRAMHGDLLGPYSLEWNSFTALCHRLLLAEPELNSSALANSVIAYSVAQAALATFFLFVFLFATGEEETAETTAWEWSAFVVLLVLLSSMPAAYHHCVLIFTVIVGTDFLLKRGRTASAVLLVLAFALACAPMPQFLLVNLQTRLIGDLLMFFLLLAAAPSRANTRVRILGYGLAVLVFGLLTLSNLRGLRNRDEDFSHRISADPIGYGTLSVSAGEDRLLVNEMTPHGYALVGLSELARLPGSAGADVLGIAATPRSKFVYFEVAGKRSRILRLPINQIGQPDRIPEEVVEGYDPVISPDGRWLAYLTDAAGKTEIHLWKDGAALPTVHSERIGDILEMSLSEDGTLIFASGGAVDPHLSMFQPQPGTVKSLADLRGATRYPAASPDGSQLAFSRRESGSWHLFVRPREGGIERQLTTSACNATAATWEDSHTLLYVSDCGRALGMGAPMRVDLNH